MVDKIPNQNMYIPKYIENKQKVTKDQLTADMTKEDYSRYADAEDEFIVFEDDEHAGWGGSAIPQNVQDLHTANDNVKESYDALAIALNNGAKDSEVKELKATYLNALQAQKTALDSVEKSGVKFDKAQTQNRTDAAVQAAKSAQNMASELGVNANTKVENWSLSKDKMANTAKYKDLDGNPKLDLQYSFFNPDGSTLDASDLLNANGISDLKWAPASKDDQLKFLNDNKIDFSDYKLMQNETNEDENNPTVFFQRNNAELGTKDFIKVIQATDKDGKVQSLLVHTEQSLNNTDYHTNYYAAAETAATPTRKLTGGRRGGGSTPTPTPTPTPDPKPADTDSDSDSDIDPVNPDPVNPDPTPPVDNDSDSDSDIDPVNPDPVNPAPNPPVDNDSDSDSDIDPVNPDPVEPTPNPGGQEGIDTDSDGDSDIDPVNPDPVNPDPTPPADNDSDSDSDIDPVNPDPVNPAPNPPVDNDSDSDSDIDPVNPEPVEPNPNPPTPPEPGCEDGPIVNPDPFNPFL